MFIIEPRVELKTISLSVESIENIYDEGGPIITYRARSNESNDKNTKIK